MVLRADDIRTIGNYRIEREIGRGGMGVVYQGHHTTLPRKVAIKSVTVTHDDDLGRMTDRLRREAQVQSQLDHPGIVKVYDYVVSGQTYYIVMEFVEGSSLAQFLAAQGRVMPVERALDLFEQILAAVAYAHSFTYLDEAGSKHRGIIHRDLKPANILITPDDRTKVTDFGIVKLVGSENTETFRFSYGTPHYVSPEQARGTPVDQRSDIYSLGIILYEMLTGNVPFGNSSDGLTRTAILRAHTEQTPRSLGELNELVTPEVERVVLRALEKDPTKRFQTTQEFFVELRRARGREAQSDPHLSYAPPSVASQPTQVIEPVPETVRLARNGYDTQPIGALTCQVCEASLQPDQKHCRTCGSPVESPYSSPATVKLSHTERGRRSGIRTALVLCLLAAAFAYGTWFIYSSARNVNANENVNANVNKSNAPNANITLQTNGNQNSAPNGKRQVAEIKPAGVAVDSSFDGYGTEPLTDGETNVRRIKDLSYNKGNWASAETPDAHWIELSFENPVRLASVYIFWGFDRNRFMPSRSVELQTANENGEWQTISTVEPGDDYDRTAFEFAAITTRRVRVVQPAQQGPSRRPFIMWVREIKAYQIAGE